MRTVNSTKRFRTRKRGHQRENDVVSRGTGTGTGTASPQVATDVGTVWNVKWITRPPQGNNAFLVASNVWHLSRRYLRVIIFEISVSSRAFALHRAVFSVYPGRVAPSYHAKFPSYHRSLSYIHKRADQASRKNFLSRFMNGFRRCDFRSSKKLVSLFFLSYKLSFFNLIVKFFSLDANQDTVVKN